MMPKSTAIWRVLLFWIAYLAIIRGAHVVRAMLPSGVSHLGWGAVSALGTLALTLAFLRWDGRRAADVGVALRPASALRLLAGLIIGFALFSVQVGVLALVTGIRLEPAGGSPPAAPLLAIATYLALASMEGLGFRGYPLRTLHTTHGLWMAQAIVAIAFALEHVLFGWPLATVLLGVIPGALLFGMAAIASRGIAMSLGVHAAWNIGSWAVGDKNTPGLWQVIVPDESRELLATIGSISFAGVLLVGAVGFYLLYRRRPTP